MSRAHRLLREQKSAVLLAGCTLLPLLSWWFVTIPGFYSPDSMAVIEQVRSGNWSNVHTTAYTAWVYVTSLGGQQWKLIPLAQVVLMGSAITFLGSTLIRQGIRTAIVATVSAVVASTPTVGAFTVTIWKDVPYAAGSVVMCALLIRGTVRHKRDTLVIVAALVASTMIASFRWNGFITVFFLLLIYVITRRPHRNAVIGIGVMGITLGLGGLIVPERLGMVDTAPSIMRSIPQFHDIAVALSDGSFTPDANDVSILTQVMPISDWIDGARTCETVDELLFEEFPNNGPASYVSADQLDSELAGLWRRIAVNSPVSLIKARLCRASGAILPFPISSRGSLILWLADSGDPELTPTRWNRELRTTANAMINESLALPIPLRSLVFRAPLWVWILLISMIFNKRWRRSPALFWAGMVSVAVLASAAITALAHDVRYVMGALIISQMVFLSCAINEVVKRVTTSRPDSRAPTRWRRRR